MSYNYTSDVRIPMGSGYLRTLDNANAKSLTKIFCACGKIVDLDKREMELKLSLNKDVECISCRNARIAKDIDLLNEHFTIDENDDECSFY